MRIALLSDCFLPRLGGIEVQVDGLARALGEAGHSVEVFTATAGPGGEHGGAVVDHGGTRVHHFSAPWTFGVPVNPLATKGIRDRLAAGGFDVAHGHMGVVSPFATATVGAAVGLGLPTAVTWHCVLDASRPLFRVLGHARRWGHAGAALSAVSSMAAARVEDVASAPVAVLPNGIDVARWAPRPGEAGPDPAGPLVVVSAVRLVRRKRPEVLLDVAEGVRRRLGERPGVRFEVFGDGPQRSRLEHAIARRGLGDLVTLRGRASREELRAAYARGGAYLSPARLEAFGIAALEARTAGLPVVALAGTGVTDFVHDGVEGLLADDDAGLVDALVRLASDPGLRAAVAGHNREVAPPTDWGSVVGATLAEYHRAGAV